MTLAGFKLPAISSVLYAGVGYVGTPVLEGFINTWLPVSITGNTIGKYAVRIGSVIGLTWLAKAVVSREAAKLVGIGGGSYVLISAVREFAPGVIPGLSAYVAPNRALAAYVPGTNRPGSALGSPIVNSGVASNGVQRRFARF